MTNYYTLDNGGTSFRVEIKDNQVNVYKRNHNLEFEENEKVYSILIATYNPQKVFVGKSPLTKMTHFSDGHSSKFDGNSMLLYLGNLEYIHIGNMIYSFTANYEIIKYVSEVGNSCVPYPYAVDKYSYIYLMIEDVVIYAKESQTMIDPYRWYYDNHYLTSLRPGRKERTESDNHISWIKDFKIGNDSYAFSYHPDPETDYDRISHFGDNNEKTTVSVIKFDGHEKILTKKDYVELINQFGMKMKFSKISNKKNIHKREF